MGLLVRPNTECEIKATGACGPPKPLGTEPFGPSGSLWHLDYGSASVTRHMGRRRLSFLCSLAANVLRGLKNVDILFLSVHRARGSLLSPWLLLGGANGAAANTGIIESCG